MALTAYIAATNRLLQNPVPANNPLYTTADLTVYVNEARQQLAIDTQCIRGLSSGPTVIAARDYPFTIFTTVTSGGVVLTGIQQVFSIWQLAITIAGVLSPMTARPYPWFYRYHIMSGQAAATGTPRIWSQQGRGSKGTFSVSPIPTAVQQMFAEVSCLPVALVDDSTPEALPSPYTDAVKYYAAYLAYLSSQREEDATTMLGRYMEFVERAVQQNAGTIMPFNQPGGVGSQMAASKVTLTTRPPPQRQQ